MKIILSPISSNKTTTIFLSGLILTIDGVPHDLSAIPIGGQAEAEAPFIGIVTRDQATIQYHYDGSLAELIQSPNLADYTFDVIDDEVPCPIRWRALDV